MAELLCKLECVSSAVTEKKDGRHQCQESAKKYLREKKVTDLLKFMIGHLLVNKPAVPVDYLSGLLGRCMDYRSGSVQRSDAPPPPLLLEDRHVEAVFKTMDPFGQGCITLQQYRTGMLTMDVKDYEGDPTTDEEGNVTKDTFIREARIAMERHLLDLLNA